jgi:hypothetical protein
MRRLRGDGTGKDVFREGEDFGFRRRKEAIQQGFAAITKEDGSQV